MTAGKSTKSVSKGKRLAVKISEANKWKPRTNFTKERQRPAPKIGSTASWTSAFTFFQQDYLKEFREKNTNDKSSGDADKAPYLARSLASEMRYRKAIAKTASYRKMWDIKCKIEVEMGKMNL